MFTHAYHFYDITTFLFCQGNYFEFLLVFI